MPLVQRVMALAIGVGLMLLVVDLVRRRKLKEEYSVLWLLLGFTVLILAAWFPLVRFLGGFLHASTTATILFFGMIFLVFIALHYSVKISKLTQQVKELAQEVTLLKAEISKHGRSNG
ncbi:MAG: DUF2304 domain-containing protein [Deltaproteobacteria bacterium]|nr:DUF2304 domain-containing protein [Deltaproteobacteria bacterium]